MATALASPRPPEWPGGTDESQQRSWAEVAGETGEERESLDSLEGGEPFRLSSWEMNKQRTKGLDQKSDKGSGTGEQEDETRRTNPIQMRNWDWRCATEECRGEINFARRREC